MLCSALNKLFGREIEAVDLFITSPKYKSFELILMVMFEICE